MTTYKYFHFTETPTLAEIKSEYRKLLQQYHPDHNTSAEAEEATKAIVAEYEALLREVMSDAFNAYQQDRKDQGQESWEQDMTPFADILAKILHMDDIEIEIIGFWIYAFNSFTRKDELHDLDFWFSKKHRAWVYSGTKKRNIRTKYTTDDNRDRLGSTKVETHHQPKLDDEQRSA